MTKKVTFDPALGNAETDKTLGKEWRQERGIQERSTTREVTSEEINSPERKEANEIAQQTALKDAGLKLRNAKRSYANLMDLAQNSNEGNSR